MEIQRRLYPYPVLAANSDDYRESLFDVAIEDGCSGHDILLSFLVTLQNDELSELLQNGSVFVGCHLECSQTSYRKIIKSNTLSFSEIIDHQKVLGKLQVCPFLIAAKTIGHYKNKAFHPDYQDSSFTIEAGCILAVGTPTSLFIEKENYTLGNIPSIFQVVRYEGPNARCLLVETDSQKIIIKIPTSSFDAYMKLKENPSIKTVLYSIVIIPALITVLNTLSQKRNELIDYENYPWYRAINNEIKRQFKWSIDSTDFVDANLTEIAQLLINAPLGEALDALVKPTDGDYDEN